MSDDESLISAICRNDTAGVKSLLAGDSVKANARMWVVNRWQSPMLVLAANHGRVEIVAHLLDVGACIDAVDNYGDTACHLAVLHGHTAVVELLVARKANLSLRNYVNATPIGIAIAERNERLVMLLIDAAIAAGTPLDDETVCLAATVSTDVIRLLLSKHRIDLSTVRDHHGSTPLHRAVLHRSDASVFDLLIEVAGVDVDAREEHGHTAALDACFSRDAGALVRLIAAGANLDLADENGATPLHYSHRHPTNQIACLLLAAGANVHAKTNNGRTACHNASERSHISLPAMMAFGADLDVPDNAGVTPRQLLKSPPPTTEEIEAARRRVFRVQLSLVRQRACDVCVGLQSLRFDALCMCEILLHSCGPVAPFVPFHRWWQIATTIKHFRGSNIEN